MKRELLLLLVPPIVFVVLILSSKVLRTVIRESVLRPKKGCDIHVGGNKVVVVPRDEPSQEEA